MSQYVSFYISDGERFISLDEFSRSTEIYKAMADFGYAPYEKCGRSALRNFKPPSKQF